MTRKSYAELVNRFERLVWASLPVVYGLVGRYPPGGWKNLKVLVSLSIHKKGTEQNGTRGVEVGKILEAAEKGTLDALAEEVARDLQKSVD